ncbi:MAG: M14 family metallopeptidase [Chitinophagaceae bacterium]|nr:M14 family metallopeptidase [Chitinophagaceae bacterium]MBP6478520.1 M14 family metallopeptidase [Chitinophagaceae bacterium]MBP7315303.1 M14 family metallopeptidase [Chitinophagaceae bacterium]HQZ51048.1 M14 family metallopeptidase [Chitinophagaceae bacterium]HRA11612.1 M14 family metallopeptidase [Chitinophagaceae bacterium]
MKKLLSLLLLVIVTTSTVKSQNITTKFEQSKGTQTPTYFEIIDWWKKLDEKSGKLKILTMGMTDAGYPLHLIVVGNNGDSNFENIRKNNKRIILINNGIHPGEPDGIDASMLLVRDIVQNKYKIPDNIVLAFIPVYNIGGCLNRSANYRVDQDGPEEFGFRGNSQNLDLNRDFIKCDSKDARAFIEIFHMLDPDVLVDNHVSNGADYQHIITLLTTQHNKLGGEMGKYLSTQFEPGIYSTMKQKGYDLIPYVNSFGDSPENGWPEYWDSPRYSSGFAALWNTFSFVPETHMLKSYDLRVKATYALMQSFIEYVSKNSGQIKQIRNQTKQKIKIANEFPVRWSLDKSQSKEVLYKGFQSGYKPSEVSGLPRLFYDRSKPFEKSIPIFNYYAVKNTVVKPKAYIIPQGWWKVIDLLKLNKIEMSQLKKDTTIEVEYYKIDDYKAMVRQYEMHHMNSDLKTTTLSQKISFKKGDWYIPLNQVANRYLIETLEPHNEDSYFSWNYFDAILGQKEGYSAYAFEDIAADYLKKNPEVKTKLDQRVATDTSFAKSGRAQLNFVYQNSPWFEPALNRYPVYRVK